MWNHIKRGEPSADVSLYKVKKWSLAEQVAFNNRQEFLLLLDLWCWWIYTTTGCLAFDLVCRDVVVGVEHQEIKAARAYGARAQEVRYFQCKED
jgi:hypothetical protein